MSTTAPAETTTKPKTERKPRNPDDPPREKRPPREQKKGDGKPREPRPPRTENKEKGEYKKKEDKGEGKGKESRPIFVKQTEAEAGTTGGEEKQTEKKHREREKRESKFDWNKDNVKIDTPIPEVPKQALLKPKPLYDDLLKQLDKIDDEVEDIHRQKKQYIDDLYNQKKQVDTNASASQTPIRETLKAKIEKKNELRKIFEDARKDTNKDKEEIERLFEESRKIREKMKICKNYDELSSELAELQHRQSNEFLTLTEEKAIIKQIFDIERSLPHAEPLAKIEKQMDELKQKSKELKKIQNDAFEQFKAMEKEVNELQDDLDEQKKSRSDNKESLEPLIAQKKEEYQGKIDALKKKKQELKDKFKKDQEAYEDEQELLQYVDWVKRKIEKLKNHEKFLKREEERKKREEEELKVVEESIPNPFAKEIELCDQLIGYLERIRPKNTKQEEKKEEVAVDLQQTLESNEWKKEKLTLITNKRDQEELPGKKNKKNQKSNQTEAVASTPVSDKLTFSVDVQRYFDEVKVVAPKTNADLEQTINEIKEKKAYFESNPKQNEGESTTAEEPAKEEKPQQKEHSKKINVANLSEEDFPSVSQL